MADHSWQQFLLVLVVPVVFLLLRAGQWKLIGILTVAACAYILARHYGLVHKPPPAMRNIACTSGKPDFSEARLNQATLMLPCTSVFDRKAMEQQWANANSTNVFKRTAPEELVGNLAYYKSRNGAFVGTPPPQEDITTLPADARFLVNATFFQSSVFARSGDLDSDGEPFTIKVQAPAPYSPAGEMTFDCRGPGRRFAILGSRRYPLGDSTVARCVGSLASPSLYWRIFFNFEAPTAEGQKWRPTEERVAGFTNDVSEVLQLLAAHIR